jgi:hypothetical protein
MTATFRCRYGCGELLHYDPDTRRVVDGSNIPHNCRSYNSPRVLLSFDELEQEISKMVDYVINVANAASKTTIYEVSSRPKHKESETA